MQIYEVGETEGLPFLLVEYLNSLGADPDWTLPAGARGGVAEVPMIPVPALVLAAIAAGKPVLVEKPAGMTAAEVTTVTELAAAKGLLFIEAFMYRCHPQIARMLDIIASGEIGTLRHMQSPSAVTFELGGTVVLMQKFDP